MDARNAGGASPPPDNGGLAECIERTSLPPSTLMPRPSPLSLPTASAGTLEDDDDDDDNGDEPFSDITTPRLPNDGGNRVMDSRRARKATEARRV